MLTRRGMAAISLGGLALSVTRARAEGATGLSPAQRRGAATIAGVKIGCSTYTFSPAAIDQAIEGIVEAGFASGELHPRQIEPDFEMRPVFPAGPGKPDLSAEHGFARAALRQWRLGVPMEHFARAGQRFRDAGVKLIAYNVNFGEDFSDAELDRSFEMTRALGADLITAVGPTRTLRRLDPFARSRKMRVAFHNEEQNSQHLCIRTGGGGNVRLHRFQSRHRSLHLHRRQLHGDAEETWRADLGHSPEGPEEEPRPGGCLR